MDKVKRNNKTITLLFSIGLIMLVMGFSYAFFIYNKTGLYTHTITGGAIKVIYDEFAGNNITIENSYPLTDEEALTKALEFEFSISGYTESKHDIYYAIEMDYGEDIDDKSRFLDTDIKLTLYENEELIYENKIFDKLDNQSIYYGIIPSGTSESSQVVNNYKMKIWINDNVIISDTLDSDANIDTLQEADLMWILSKYDTQEEFFYELIEACPEIQTTGNFDGCNLSKFGIKTYKTEEFATKYTNFKVNVRANLTGEDIGILVYDANNGSNEIFTSNLVVNRITAKKPVKEEKSFLGWSSDKNATTAEYYAGDYYSGNGGTLYAIYSDNKNVMGTFPEEMQDISSSITHIYFVNDTKSNIESKYNSAAIKFDLTHPDYLSKGQVLGWVEEVDEEKVVLYIGSEGTTYLSNCVNLFSMFSQCYYIDLVNVETVDVTDMSFMFSNAGEGYNQQPLSSKKSDNYLVKRLESKSVSNNYLVIDRIDGLNTSNVTNMSGMFSNSGILKLNLSSFDTSQVTNMSGMFSSCRAILNLDLGNFNTSQVTDMSEMFYDCWDLISVNINSFNTKEVTNMRKLFGRCFAIKNINLGNNFITNKVTDMSYMFEKCDYLSQLDLSSFDTSQVKDMSYMFYSNDFEILDLSNFDTAQVMNMEYMFSYCSKLESLDLSNFDTTNVTNMAEMFNGCSSLINLDLSNFNTGNVTDVSKMFLGCSSLTNFDVSKFDTRNVTNMLSMFSYCSSLTNLGVSNFNTSSVTNMSHMFDGCTKLTELDLSNFDTTNVTNMSGMFCDCSNLTTLKLSNFVNNSSYTVSITSMFSRCGNLNTIDLSGFDLSKSTSNYNIFYSVGSNLSTGTYTTVYVKDEASQNWILNLSTSYRPSGWSTNNIIIKSA